MNPADDMPKDDAPKRDYEPIDEQRGFVARTLINGLKFAEQISKTAATLPLSMLESMGVSEEKTKGPKAFNLRLVDSVFRLTNKLTNRTLALFAAPSRRPGGNKRAAERETTD